MKTEQHVRFVKDNSGHNYIIPADKHDDWQAFCELDKDDPTSYDVLNDDFINDDLICDDGELVDVNDLPYALPQGFINLPTTKHLQERK